MSAPTETKIPKQSGKTGLGDLQFFPRMTYLPGRALSEHPTLYHRSDNGLQFDMLWRPLPGSNRLFVFFSGDAMRSKNEPPVFQRWSWAPFFPGHCVYFSDPSLHLDKRIGLAWYAGTEERDPLTTIGEIIRDISLQHGVARRQIFTYGSSGGGFAALRMLTILPDICAICINPQIIVTDYEKSSTDRYLQICFNGRNRADAIATFPERLSILPHASKLNGRQIIYIQNTLDTHHFEQHYRRFCRAMNAAEHANANDGNFRRLLFSHEGGHRKAETQEMFDAAMRIVRDWSEGIN